MGEGRGTLMPVALLLAALAAACLVAMPLGSRMTRPSAALGLELAPSPAGTRMTRGVRVAPGQVLVVSTGTVYGARDVVPRRIPTGSVKTRATQRPSRTTTSTCASESSTPRSAARADGTADRGARSAIHMTRTIRNLISGLPSRGAWSRRKSWKTLDDYISQRR